MKYKKNNKKGLAVMELLLGVVVLLILAIVATQGMGLFTELNEDLQNSTDVNSVAKNVSQQAHDAYSPTLDGAFALFLVLLLVLNLVFSYYSDAAPFLLILLYIVLIAILVVAGFLSNTWEEYTDDSSVVFESSFPITDYVLNNFMLVIAVFGFSSLLIVFLRDRIG